MIIVILNKNGDACLGRGDAWSCSQVYSHAECKEEDGDADGRGGKRCHDDFDQEGAIFVGALVAECCGFYMKK